VAVGVGTGIIIGLVISRFLKGLLTEYKPLFILAIALITYAVAENVGGSGMLAVAVCGLIAGNLAFPQKEKTRQFEDYFSEMLRISVFTLLGAQIILSFEATQFLLTLLFFLLIFFSRPIFAIPSLGEKLKADFNTKDLILISLAAPRGLAAAAMAPIAATILISAGQTTIASQILNIIFYVIMFSIVASSVVAYFIKKTQPRLPEELPGKVIEAKAEEEPYLEIPVPPVKAKRVRKIIKKVKRVKKSRRRKK
jgi:NhaP-type Na+/H+ or K+/H+ antiporter